MYIQRSTHRDPKTTTGANPDSYAPRPLTARSLLKALVMARIKRWTEGILVRLDSLVVQVENHEALAESAIRELERGIGRTRLHLNRVQRDGRTLKQALADEREATTRWHERARTEADQSRALESLRRHRRSKVRVTELENDLAEHQNVEERLRRDVQTLERRLGELRQQQNTMQTRASRAEAFSAVRGSTDSGRGEVEEVFERWETRILESEIASGCPVAELDDFEETLVDAEETASLELELRALKEERR